LYRQPRSRHWLFGWSNKMKHRRASWPAMVLQYGLLYLKIVFGKSLMLA